MGGGASSAGLGSPKTKDDRSADTNTTCCTDAGGNGVSQQWLMSTIEKERKEKEWLAHKYDERCAEVLALQEEVRALRTKVQPSCGTTGSAAGSEAAREGLSPSLAQRRSLTLNNVQTGKHASSVKLAPDRPDEADETDKAAPQLTASTTADGVEAEACPGVLSHVSYDSREPTKEGPEVGRTKSQLLRRRTGVDGEAGATVDRRSGSAELEVTAADKIFSMVDNPEEEPVSPKRSSGGRAARGRRTGDFEEDLRPEEL